jgi:DNA-binding beta-propeller fold protein YncE
MIGLSFRSVAFLAGGLTAAIAGAKDGAPLLVPGPTIEVSGSHGKFDFLEIDAVGRRLLASHTADGTVDIFDLTTNRLLARPATGGAQDITRDPRTGKYFAGVGAEKKVAIIDGQTFAITNTIATDGPCDAMLFDPKNRCVYAAHDDGKELWVINADTEKIVATAAIPGAPEAMVYDPAADRIYLNIKTNDELVVIDPAQNAVIARWPTAPAKGPHGLAFDPKSGRLFAAGNNGQLVVLDVSSGRVIATVGITPKVDQIAFDSGVNRIYCAASETLSVVQPTPEGAVLLGNVTSFPGAKNVAVDLKTHAVWTTHTDGKNAYAKSWILP